MDKQEIINKAMDRAEAGGWIARPSLITIADWQVNLGVEDWAPMIIFTKAFARGFWGSDPTGETNGKEQVVVPHTHTNAERTCGCAVCAEGRLPAWQYHLKQMVLFTDPLEYLAKFL